MSLDRSPSPTTQLWSGRRTAWEQKARMINLGLHIFNPGWQGGPIKGRIFSSTFKEISLKVFGTDEELAFPVQVCTTIGDIRQALSRQLMVPELELDFVVKAGCSYKKLLDQDQVHSRITVKGIKSFKVQPQKWPHPTAVFGCGYHGQKTLMMYVKSGNTNVVGFDRNDKLGGYCWITAANKTSKLQTEIGSFHIWWGAEMLQGRCQYPADYEIWPKKEKVLAHFQAAAEEFGILPHISFKSNVAKLDIVGNQKDHSHYYNLHVQNLEDETSKEVHVSVIYNYPGSMTKNRIVEYPGEDTFGGIIGYGMNDETPYDSLKGSNTAILGNGAFAVECIRTCIEFGANKVYLLTRRKNLASPRPPCWFIHQGPIPTPGRMVLKMFEPMYTACGFGDPWDFWSVHASKDREKVTVMQNSRFGIGDVTFLAVAVGRCEFVQDTVKRMTQNTLHLDSGRKLSNVNNVLKALGLLGDYSVDRLHKMSYMQGNFCAGDWRRVLMIDATGMNAANFTTFSTGIGTTGFVRNHKYLHEFPQVYYGMVSRGYLEQLPQNKAREKEDKPAYVTDVKFVMSAGIITETLCPKLGELNSSDVDYKYRMYHRAHGLDFFLRECVKSWDEYQETWKKDGFKFDYVPYPYDREMMEGFFSEYSQFAGFPCSPDGPPQDSLPPESAQEQNLGALPTWATDENAVRFAEDQSIGEAKSWWQQKADYLPGFDTKGMAGRVHGY